MIEQSNKSNKFISLNNFRTGKDYRKEIHFCRKNVWTQMYNLLNTIKRSLVQRGRILLIYSKYFNNTIPFEFPSIQRTTNPDPGYQGSRAGFQETQPWTEIGPGIDRRAETAASRASCTIVSGEPRIRHVH